jgi:hypothetical protein
MSESNLVPAAGQKGHCQMCGKNDIPFQVIADRAFFLCSKDCENTYGTLRAKAIQLQRVNVSIDTTGLGMADLIKAGRQRAFDTSCHCWYCGANKKVGEDFCLGCGAQADVPVTAAGPGNNELADKAKEKTSGAPGATLEQKLEATKKLFDETTQILDLREKMALARQSLAAAQMRILLEPRGYGPPSEYQENCRAIMKNSREIERVAKQWRKSLRKLGQDEPAQIREAVTIAAKAKGELRLWERIRFSFG